MVDGIEWVQVTSIPNCFLSFSVCICFPEKGFLATYVKVHSDKTRRHRQAPNFGLVGQMSIIREFFLKMGYLLALLAPAAGIQQLVAISSWRQSRFHCNRIKNKSGGI